MNDSDLFDAVFQKYGVQLNEEIVEAFGLSRMLRDLRDIYPQAYCGYIGNPRPNAIAANFMNTNFVAVFSGLTQHLCCFFLTLFSQPDLFPEIGDAAKEVRDDERIEKLSSPLRDIPTFVHCMQPPKCRTRSLVAQNLIGCAHLFIVFHEMSHLEFGHLNLVRRRFGAHVYEELPMGELSDEESLTRRCLELHADTSATLGGLKWWRLEWPSTAGAQLGLECDDLWAVSLDALFVFWDWISAMYQQARGLTHPPPIVRLLNARHALGNSALEGIVELSTTSFANGTLGKIFTWLKHHSLWPHGRSLFEGRERAVDEWLQLQEVLKPMLDEFESFYEERKRLRGQAGIT